MLSYNKYQFVLIQQSQSRSFLIQWETTMTLEIWMKNNLWRKVVGEILKEFLVTVKI